MGDELLSVCELAARLGRSERYVREMKARGFRMVGGRATLGAALDFLEDMPHPCGATSGGGEDEDGGELS